MSSNQIIVNEDGSVELPKSAGDSKCLELVWDGQLVTASKGKIPSRFINGCQDTLKSHSSIVNVISTEAVEGIEGLGFPIRVPSLFDPYVSKIPPMWGDNIGGLGSLRGTVILIGSQLDLLLKELVMNWGESGDYEVNLIEGKLIEKIAGKAISGPLLEDFAAKLNKDITSTIMDYGYFYEDSSLDEVIGKNSRGEYRLGRWSNPFGNRIRSYGVGTKIMLNPQALGFVPAKKNAESWTWENALGNIPLCLNWDMPEPSDGIVEVLVGDFSQFMMVLKPIKLTLEYSGNLWTIKAETQALCGLWSAVSPSFAKAKVELQR